MNNFKSRLNTENGIEITSVGQYLEKIKEISEDADGFTLFFRGQQTEYWDIQSSIFRESKLNIEHKLMKLPKSKLPLEFSNNCDAFDLMTKCQHYGLCIRLLDITTNPLVALYFACKISGPQEYEKDPEQEYSDDKTSEQMEPWGIIYYTTAYPYYSYSREVQIVSNLAQYNLERENSLKDILLKLKNEHIITKEDFDKWSKKENSNEFIKIIQTNYAVIPTSNNERTKRQSGAFLLPGMFSVIKDSQNEFQIYKSCKSLKEEFNEKFFYVNGEDKEIILKELDICNINESTLFPELEHQLNYIKESNTGSYEAPYFEKYDEHFLNESKVDIIQTEDINPNFENELMDYINSKINNNVISEKIKDSIISTISIDWYKKDSILSQMKNNITRLLIAVSMPMDSAKFIANDILNNAILLYKAKGE